ncbi:2'-5' RNA ligase family protein [Saccharomonospora xinjiangensis]|uniref:RNA 2',3'-cyclic phosphodiesterase n=1 Tax=Saccharomonospora xinjiangensis XJ-54 TaxID=882086 RepID=I0UXR5_9PSEU|nr:2'-5' RNA ligase family protein [Saccharomonospora xinjiangensis]EID52668.1 2'-5' RNA ligase [Saccharomonospora xinjiangensis XJ-54]
MAERARLFSAVIPPPGVVTALHRELRQAGHRRSPGLRWTTRARWHITLGFYGTDLIEQRAEWLRTRLAGLAAPVVRIEGAGSFRGVLWMGVRGRGLDEVAAAARPDGENRPYIAHLTLALARRGTWAQERRTQSVIERWRTSLAEVRSPEWAATEVVLMRSEPSREPGGAPLYSVVTRFALDAPG